MIFPAILSAFIHRPKLAKIWSRGSENNANNIHVKCTQALQKKLNRYRGNAPKSEGQSSALVSFEAQDGERASLSCSRSRGRL